MATTRSGSENPTDDVPDGWTQTDDLEWRRDDGALLRIRSTFPVRSPAEFNSATRTDAGGQFEVLFHESALPSTPVEIATVGTRTAARQKAFAAMEERCIKT